MDAVGEAAPVWMRFVAFSFSGTGHGISAQQFRVQKTLVVRAAENSQSCDTNRLVPLASSVCAQRFLSHVWTLFSAKKEDRLFTLNADPSQTNE